jgi:Fic family protein
MSNDDTSQDRSKGGRKRRVRDPEILRVFTETDQPVLTTADVAATLPIGTRQTYERLATLYDGEVIERRKVGPRTYVWWRPGYTTTG